MYDAATEMKATAAGYMRISDVNAQGSNYQEATYKMFPSERTTKSNS